MYKNEKQLQSAMVIEFSQKYPEKDGQLFSVRNTTFSVRDGQTQKAMGMKKGVSDLIYFDNGNLIGIEVKLPGSNHDRPHILDQYVWGETIEKNGGEYFIVTSVEGFMAVIENKDLTDDTYTLEMIKEILDSDRKGIIF